MSRKNWPVSVAVLFLGACSAVHIPEPVTRLSIMTFNVENLFDAKHDAGKTDQTYLPAALKQSAEHFRLCATIQVQSWREQCLYWDWTDQVLAYRFARISEVIRQVNNGCGPDIMAFQEVENKAVLERFRQEYLADLGYLETVLIEGGDRRGIDVAFMSRLPLAAPPILHAVEFRSISQSQLGDTRGILQADFMLPDGSILTGFAVHFPAPFHPYELRIDSYLALNRLVQDLPAGRFAFAAGDFNTPAAEDQQHQILSKHVEREWRIAHQEGCSDCVGTYYYEPRNEWSFLDMILVRRLHHGAAEAGHWQFEPQSTRVISGAADQLTADGYPAGFKIEPLSGFSDHLPLVIEVVNRQKSDERPGC